MKTDKEILNFYEVEFGKRYKITHQDDGVFVGEYLDMVFEIVKEKKHLLLKDIHCKHTLDIQLLRYFDYKEVKNPLIDEEKDYLSAVVKPFKKRVLSIAKCKFISSEHECISIKLTENGSCILSYFAPGTMYKDMEVDKEYIIEDLGL